VPVALPRCGACCYLRCLLLLAVPVVTCGACCYLRCCKPPAHLICAISVRVRVLVCVCTSCVRLCTGAFGAQEVGEAYAGPDGDPEVAMPQQNPLKPPALRVHDIFGPRRLSIPRSLVTQPEPNRRAVRVRAFDCART
jgi:hypothetical protein